MKKKKKENMSLKSQYDKGTHNFKNLLEEKEYEKPKLLRQMT
jgi:hypothetical protein